MMTTTRSLSPVLRQGSFQIATLDERQVTGWAFIDRLAASGTKRPLAVLIATDGALAVRDMDGRRLGSAALDALCPGALAEFRAATGATQSLEEEEEETDP
jgi:hypothetical protein